MKLATSKVCQRPDIPQGKLITEDPDAVWIKANETGTVTCEPGFTLSGESSVKCLNGSLKTPTGGDLTAKCMKVSAYHLIELNFE